MGVAHLPFVSNANGRLSLWEVASSGEYSADCATGRRHFSQLHRLMRDTDNPLLLARVLAEQATKKETWGGVEVGFHAAMAERLLST